MSAIYNLTLRQWKRKRINEVDLQQLVDDIRITEQEKIDIMQHPQDE